VVEGSLREAGSRSGSVASSSKRRAASIFGPTVSTVLSAILSICRSGSPTASSARSAVLREAEIEPTRRKPETEQGAHDPTLRAFPPTFTETPERSEEALWLLSEAPSRHGVSSSAT
jgi:hypothetical protein